MKKYLYIIFGIIIGGLGLNALTASAQFPGITVPQGGTGTTSIANGQILFGSTTIRTSSSAGLKYYEGSHYLGVQSKAVCAVLFSPCSNRIPLNYIPSLISANLGNNGPIAIVASTTGSDNGQSGTGAIGIMASSHLVDGAQDSYGVGGLFFSDDPSSGASYGVYAVSVSTGYSIESAGVYAEGPRGIHAVADQANGRAGFFDATNQTGGYAIYAVNGKNYFSNNVGIGTTSPYAALSIVGSTGVVADHYVATSTTASSTFAGGVQISNSKKLQFLTLTGNEASIYSTGTDDIIYRMTVGVEYHDTDEINWTADPAVGSNGVGILDTPRGPFVAGDWIPQSGNFYDLGTTTAPWRKLSAQYASTTVTSATTFCLTGDTCLSSWPTGGVGSGTTGQVPYYAANGTSLTATSTIFIDTMSDVGIATSSPWGSFSINPKARSDSGPAFVVGSSSATSLIVSNQGYVGVGTTSPWVPLSVSNSNANLTSLSVSGKGNGGTVTICQIEWRSKATGSQLGCLSDTNNDVAGSFYLIATSSNVSFGEMSDFFVMDRAISGADKRAVGFVGRTVFRTPSSNNSTGYRMDIAQKIDPSTFRVTNSFLPLGFITGSNVDNLYPASQLSVGGNASIGTTYYTTNAAPSSGLLVQGATGVGTTSPWATLSVSTTTANAGVPLFAVGSSTNATSLVVTGNSQVGIGTTTPFTELSIQSNDSSTPLFSLSTTTAKTLVEWDTSGHKITGGYTPTCGAGCSSVTGDDQTMRVISGSSVTAVTVNFSKTYTTTPVCLATEESAGTLASDASSTPTSVTLNISAAVTSVRLGIICQISSNFAF